MKSVLLAYTDPAVLAPVHKKCAFGSHPGLYVKLEGRSAICDSRIRAENLSDRIGEFHSHGLGVPKSASVVIELLKSEDVPRNLVDGRLPVLNINPQWHRDFRSV